MWGARLRIGVHCEIDVIAALAGQELCTLSPSIPDGSVPGLWIWIIGDAWRKEQAVLGLTKR
jgi:hypothetical protein